MTPSKENCKLARKALAEILNLLTQPPEGVTDALRQMTERLKDALDRSPRVRFIDDFLRSAEEVMPSESTLNALFADDDKPIHIPGIGTLVKVDLTKSPKPAPQPPKPKVTICPCCDDPLNPDPLHHPDGQCKHVLKPEEPR